MTGGSLGQAGRLERMARELLPGAPIGARVPRCVGPALGFLVFPVCEARLGGDTEDGAIAHSSPDI